MRGAIGLKLDDSNENERLAKMSAEVDTGYAEMEL
jgi:hypothetical protein